MRHLLAFVSLLMAVASISYADTTWVTDPLVSGAWTADHSPYMIQVTIHVPQDHALSIGRGVRVCFVGEDSLVVDSLARFNAIGLVGDSITFTTDILANPGRWGGIVIHNAVDTCRFEYCVFENANGHDIWRSALCFHNTNMIIRHSSFRHMVSGNLLFFGGSIDMSDCRLSDNQNTEGDPDGCALDIYPHCPGRVANCTFESNTSVNDGGAVDVGNWSLQDTVFFIGCTFRKNTAAGAGGGLQNEGGIVVIQDCWFEDNQARYGGALAAHFWPLIVKNTTVIGNLAEYGGGIDGTPANTLLYLTDCLIAENQATIEGGGISRLGNSSIVERCVLDHNSSPNAGAISVKEYSNAMIRNCTLVRNSATEHGAAIYNYNFDNTSSPFVINSIIAFNGPADACMHLPQGSYHTHHCDFFGNAGPNFFQSDSVAYYSSIYLDPLFADMAAGDFHLTAGSPCIDAGWANSPHDPDGTVADMGAFYYDQTPDAAQPHPIPVPVSLSLSSWPNPFNPVTEIRYDVPKAASISLRIFDLLGRDVATLVNKPLTAGSYSIQWNAEALPSGMYFAVLRAGAHTAVHKLLLMK
jgi:hypothetical protein